MRKGILIVASLTLYLTACTPAITQVAFVPPGCQRLPDPPTCVGNRNNPSVTINMTAHSVAPPNVCAKPNQKINFKVVFGSVTEAPATVGTLPKDVKDVWLLASNSPDANNFSVTAPAEDDEYDYSVLFADGECRDPRITVGT